MTFLSANIVSGHSRAREVAPHACRDRLGGLLHDDATAA
jgi:hypothetical protein